MHTTNGPLPRPLKTTTNTTTARQSQTTDNVITGQGGRGIALREDHPVEGAVLAFLREHGVEALSERLVITFGDAKALENFEL